MAAQSPPTPAPTMTACRARVRISPSWRQSHLSRPTLRAGPGPRIGRVAGHARRRRRLPPGARRGWAWRL